MKLKTHSELEEQIQREPLQQRLERCIDIIGRLASEGRPPKMSIPVQASDEDVFLTTTIQDAATFRATVAAALDLYESALSEAEAILGGEYGDEFHHLMEAVDKARAAKDALGLENEAQEEKQ